MEIIRPEGTAPIADATEPPGYVTLAYEESTLTLPTLPRPNSNSDTVYWTGSALQFEPGTPPVIAAVLACHAGQTTLTLFPLPDTTAPTPAPAP